MLDVGFFDNLMNPLQKLNSHLKLFIVSDNSLLACGSNQKSNIKNQASTRS